MAANRIVDSLQDLLDQQDSSLLLISGLSADLLQGKPLLAANPVQGQALVWSDASQAWVASTIVSQPGPAGTRGVPGPQGSMGLTGNTGANGMQGPPGYQLTSLLVQSPLHFDSGSGTVSLDPLGILQSSNNLSDITNAPLARSNLGLGSAALLSVGTTVGTVPDAGAVTAALSSKLDATTIIAQSQIAGLSAALSGMVSVVSPTFTGTPTAPTPTSNDNSTAIATTAYVQSQSFATTAALNAAITTKANAASPTLTGTVTIGSATGLVKTTSGVVAAATPGTDYVTPTGSGAGLTSLNASNIASGTVPYASLPTGTTAGTLADAGAVANSLAAKASLASPSLTGTPTAPTPTITNNSTAIATTAYVQGQGYATSTALNAKANAASPTLTGTVTIGSATGLVKTTTGIVAAATPGTDYVVPNGSGAGLTSLNASNIASGTVSYALLPVGTTVGTLADAGAVTTSLAMKAPLASPALTGAPTVNGLVVTTKYGERLRRAARKALMDNPWSKLYMARVPAWRPSTSYAAYNVVVNGGNIYVCAGGGTSAASGGPTYMDSTAHLDNTVYWIYYGTNIVTVDPSSIPSSWVASTSYALGTIVLNGTSLYACVAAGTSTTGGGPTGPSNSITDGGVTWSYYGNNRGAQYVNEFPIYSSVTTLSADLSNPYVPINAISAGAISAQVIAGGSGYAVNDTITLTGGTSSTSTVLKVMAVLNGAVTAVSVQTPGSYTVLPTSPPGQGSSSGSGTNATFVVRWPDPPYCALRGCYNGGSRGSGNFAFLYTFQATANATPTSGGTAFEFYSDAPKMSFRQGGLLSSSAIIIDGVRYGPSLSYNVADSYHVFDFSSSSGRKIRHYRIEANATYQLGQITVDAYSQVWAPSSLDRIRAVLISDSIFAGSGYGPFWVGNLVAFRLAHELGWNDVCNFTQGGTGYTNRGTSPGVVSDIFGYRLNEAVALNPDMWVLAGSINDLTQSASTITAAVTAALTTIRASSSAPIVVLGLWCYNDSALATGHKVSDGETAVQAGVMAAADPLGMTFFIPVRNDPFFPWISGSWNNLGRTVSTNATAYVAGDNTHPPDPGTAYWVQRIATAIRMQVLPNL